MEGNQNREKKIMAINAQKETFRGYGKIRELTAQTAVECRFSSEV